MANYLFCRCPTEGCKKPMMLWQTKCGIVESNAGEIAGIWMYTYCEKCGVKYMADFATSTAIVGWLDLKEEVPMSELKPQEVRNEGNVSS